jgi:hypothetical protein
MLSECRYAECHYAKCRYAECRYAECHYAECHYAECHYAACRYAKCRYAECYYAECCVVPFNPLLLNCRTWFKETKEHFSNRFLNSYWNGTSLYNTKTSL